MTLHLFDALPSTNRWLEEHVAGKGATGTGTDRALCAVDLQSDGRGRRARDWVSVRGNVALSLFERLALVSARLPALSLVTGIAVAETLREASGLDVRLKWPNDLIVGGAKLGGLLGSTRPCAGVPTGVPCAAVVSGIGLNLVHDERLAALGIGGTSLAAQGVAGLDRDALLGTLAARVFLAHAHYVRDGWACFAARWQALDWLAGREIDVHGVDGVERGRALGVDASGALRVRTGAAERVIHGGEVSIRPRDRSRT